MKLFYYFSKQPLYLICIVGCFFTKMTNRVCHFGKKGRYSLITPELFQNINFLKIQMILKFTLTKNRTAGMLKADKKTGQPVGFENYVKLVKVVLK
jgi:hypothetical protein